MTDRGRALPAPARERRALGILAGGGTLPIEIAECAGRAGRPVHIIALDGEADASLAGFAHTIVNWGQIGRMVSVFRDQGCRELVLAGTVRRPDLRSLRPDLGLFLALPRLLRTLRGGDDSVLRRVIGFFESKGFKVVGLADVAPHLLAPLGCVGSVSPTSSHEAAVERGLALLDALGPFDVGQAVVATQARIVAIEGAGGTDAMLAQLPDGLASGGVLIKWPKPGQELRLDLPTIGPRTIERAAEAGLAGIAVQAAAAVILDRDVVRRGAQDAGLFVVGLASPAQVASNSHRDPDDTAGAEPMVVCSRRAPTPAEWLDIAIGRRLLSVLAPHGVGDSAVVARQHVLAVAAGEPVKDVIARAGGLRQWGRSGRKRVGIVLLRNPIDARALETLADGLVAARLAGAVLMSPPAAETLDILVARFDEARLHLVVAEPAP